jgi:hypothetical protein
MRARRARELRAAAPLAVALLLASSVLDATASIQILRGLDPAARVELRALRTAAKNAPRAESDAAWFRVAVLALGHATSIDSPGAPDDPEVTKALSEACDHLPALALAAVAAHGSHPIVSERFCAAVLRTPPGAGRAGRTDLSGPAEAAAEARDALVRFGGKGGREFVDIVRKGDAPAPGAGAAQRSVFAIRIVLSPHEDAASGLSPGVQAGVRAAAGAWADRFDVRPSWIAPGDEETAFGLDGLDGPVRPGVILVGAEGPAHVAALTHGLAQGALVVDARRPRSDFVQPGWSAVRSDTADAPADDRLSGGLPQFGSALEYPRSISFARSPARPWQDEASFALRPPGIERGRRLAQVLRERPGMDTVAIALPESGGDLELARGFAGALRALGRTVHTVSYAPGRRDFTPEAKRFVATGAKVILLAGPGDESSEWLAALTRLRARPLVLGSSELDPEGFRPQDRSRFEGAIFVGDDWEDRDSTFAHRVALAVAEAEHVDAADVRRGFRLGFLLARAVVEGGWTPSALARELSLRSIARISSRSTHALVRFDEGTAADQWSVELPLYEIRQGTAVRQTVPGHR